MELGPAQSQHVSQEDGCILEGTVGVRTHLTPVEELALLLLLHALLRGHETSLQVNTTVHKGQPHNHSISIDGWRRKQESESEVPTPFLSNIVHLSPIVTDAYILEVRYTAILVCKF